MKKSKKRLTRTSYKMGDRSLKVGSSILQSMRDINEVSDFEIEKIMPTSRYLWILDSGHGGVNEKGIYVTAGKRSYFKDKKLMDVKSLGVDYCEKHCDYKYYEGEGNRQIMYKVGQRLEKLNIRHEYTVDPDDSDDIPLRLRTKLANDLPLPTSEKKFISNHSDGFNKESAHGTSFFTSKGYTLSDDMAIIFYEEWAKLFPNGRLRKGKKGIDKENNLHITRETEMSALLLENCFHTNWKEYSEILGTEDGQNKIVSYIVNAIVRCEKEL